jgi:superfamily II DNA or RNA helicase
MTRGTETAAGMATARSWARAVFSEDHWARALLTPARADPDLPAFQRDAADRIAELLSTQGGAVLADEVGLGKTWVAIGALAALRSRWPRALVVAPATVLPAWRRASQEAAVQLVSDAALVRSPVSARGFDVLVVDEAHRARNPATRRHALLAELARDRPTLLLTATPYIHSARDLAALLRLVAPAAPVGASPDVATLRLRLASLTVRRTRPELERVYGPLRLPDGRALATRSERERLRPPLGEAANAVAESAPSWVAAAFPEPALLELRAALEYSLLHRLASSPAALAASVRRLRGYLERAAEAHEAGRTLSRRAFARDFAKDLADLVYPGPRQAVLPFFFSGPADRGQESPGYIDAEAALVALSPCLGLAARALEEPDPKAEALLEVLARAERPALVMTAYGATARWLHELLRRRGWPGVGLLTGREARAGNQPIRRRDLLARFAPEAQGARIHSALRVEVLVATDVLREGVNLQDARTVIHFDRAWNPASARQREGRVDRFARPDGLDLPCHPGGDAARPLRFVTLDPPPALEARLGLARRFAARAREAARLLEGDGEGLLDERSWALAFARGAGPAAPPLPGGASGWRLEGAAEGGWLVAVAMADRVRVVWLGAEPGDGLARLLRWLDRPLVAETQVIPSSSELDAALAVAAGQRCRALEPIRTGERLATRGRAALDAAADSAARYRRGEVAPPPRALGVGDRWDLGGGREGRFEARVVGWVRVVVAGAGGCT